MNPLPIVWANLRRNPFTTVLFVGVVALAVALGIAISAQERALRQGSARAADRFDLIVAAPGSPTDVLLSVVYLDPTAVELLPPDVSAGVLNHPRAAIAAPIGFGDNIEGDPVVGTISAFVEHLSGGLADGRPFTAINEAVVGALSPHAIGETLHVAHGEGSFGGADADAAADSLDHDHDHADDHDEAEHAHGDHADLVVVGRMQPTGTPWDRAVVVPIEYNWLAHDLPIGHAAGETRIGPPFDPAALPGVPAIVVKPVDVATAYGLRGEYRTAQSTAFFPAEVLVELYAVLGDVARVMSALTFAAQALVIAAILAGVVAILDLQRQRFAVLRALGAPPAFVFATAWLYVAFIVVVGSAIGLLLGWAAAGLVSQLVAGETGVAMSASIGATEVGLVLAIVATGLVLATLPALLIYRRPVVHGLRQ